MQSGWWEQWQWEDANRSGGSGDQWWTDQWWSGDTQGWWDDTQGWWDADSVSGYSAAPGDSEATDTEEVADGDGAGSAAPAAVAGAIRNTTPIAVVSRSGGGNARRNAALIDREDVGNIGWFFGNWGKRSASKQMQKRIDDQLKKNPCQILGLCECQQETETILQMGEAGAGKDPAVAGKHQAPEFAEREDNAYLTLRGNEEVSVLLGVRSAVAEGIDLLMWKRIDEGTYKKKNTAKSKAHAYTRVLVAKIRLKNSVGYMGKEQTVMVVHLHNLVANKAVGFRRNNDKFWPWLADRIKEHGVQVMMGDFNMSLFKVVPELRSRGVEVSLGAWYPWKTPDDVPMADSCGIFMCMPCTRIAPVFDENVLDEPAWSYLEQEEENGGPGQPLETYLPKTQDLKEKLECTFKPAVAGTALVATKGAQKGKRCGLEVREKRLDVDIWKFEGKNYKGSHFPLALFTRNVGRRSEERYVARQRRKYGDK